MDITGLSRNNVLINMQFEILFLLIGHVERSETETK